MVKTTQSHFRDYIHEEAARYPVRIVTPDDGYYIHNFFDVRPWSPSGRYLACLKLPFQDRIPGPHDVATVCVIDLKEETISEVYETKGWGLQVGAHVCWGATDDILLFNHKGENEVVHAVEYHLPSHMARKLSGAVYQAALDGSAIYSPALDLINYSQNGYGATIDPAYQRIPAVGASEDEGLWKVDVESNRCTLLFSLRQAYELLPDKTPFEGGRFVFFHMKLNRQQDRIMQVVRCVFDDGRPQRRFIITMDLEGGQARIALPYELWLDGSHHPDWHPDGRSILMNIQLNELRFCRFSSETDRFTIVAPQVRGGGHPSFSPDSRYILTDAYTFEPCANEKHEVPIRLIETDTGSEQPLCYIWTLGGTDLPADLRCDPHPVWSRDGRQVCFNGTPDGRRQILVADVSALYKE